MILVAGGIADKVTELVCARLNDCGYAYRFLDLGRYPSGHGIAVRWTGAGPEGSIRGPDWQVDLADISGVYVRFLGPEGRLLAAVTWRLRRPPRCAPRPTLHSWRCLRICPARS